MSIDFLGNNISNEGESIVKAFIKKITKKTELTFAEVVTYIQEKLQPYWHNLPHE